MTETAVLQENLSSLNTQEGKKEPYKKGLKNVLLSLAACVILVVGTASMSGNLDSSESIRNANNSKETYYNGYNCTAGMNLLLIKDIDHAMVDLSIDELKNAGIDCLSINVLVGQNGQFGSEVFAGENTPDNETIERAIDRAHENGMKVTLRPLLDEASFTEGHWRGTIEPQDTQAWFESYGNIISEYAKLAEENDVELFSVGAELASMEKHEDEWKNLIAETRNNFSGGVSYSLNAVGAEKNGWIPELDLLGLDVYIPGKECDVEEDITQKLLDEVKDVMYSGKQSWPEIIITEAGAPPEKCSNLAPPFWGTGAPESWHSQAIVYRSVCTASKKLGFGEAITWWGIKIGPEGGLGAFSPFGGDAKKLLDCNENN